MSNLIALDWGTTRLRAALLDGDGAVLEEREAESGVGDLDEAGFANRFRDVTAGWQAGRAIACGMVGSRQGWREARYLACPSPLKQIASHATRFSLGGIDIAILPGLTVKRDNGAHDVMRGEETQLVGLVSTTGRDSGVVVLPGSHSKWVRLENSTVTDFLTLMTGELFAAIANETILRHTLPQVDFDEAAFSEGCAAAKAADGAVWPLFFRLRADALMGEARDGARDYLSGLLIGSEFASAFRDGFNASSVSIIGSAALLTRYRAAAAAFGLEAHTARGTDLVWPALHSLAGRHEERWSA